MIDSDLSKERLIGSRELITCVCPHCNSETIPYYETYDELKNSPSHTEHCTKCGKYYSFMVYEDRDGNCTTRAFPLFEYRFIYGHVMRCPESGDYYGHILGTRHGMTFAGETLELAEQDFRIIVDVYIDEVMRDPIV